jgi:hypothetical protein
MARRRFAVEKSFIRAKQTTMMIQSHGLTSITTPTTRIQVMGALFGDRLTKKN